MSGATPISKVGALLPARKPFEQAIAAGMSDDLPVPIAQAFDPAQTPLNFLPWLAGHRSVDLWFEDWAESRKRAMVGDAYALAALKGTRAGAVRYLSYVDCEMIAAVAYPARFVMTRVVVGRTPIGHPPFLARYLLRVRTQKPLRAFVFGRSFCGINPVKRPSRDPFDRALAALRVAMAPETQIRVSFAHKRLLTVADLPNVNAGHHAGEWIDRTSL